jgi:hypothetical protein
MERLIITNSKLGYSLRHISELTQLIIDEVKDTLGQATGSISSLENRPAIECLITSSSTAVVGASCLEEDYSSLVEDGLQGGCSED